MTLYSYGYHFKAAVNHPGKCFLINSRQYSSSTARHLSYARYAISNYIEVPKPDAATPGDHEENALYLFNEYDQSIGAAIRSRTKFDFLSGETYKKAKDFVKYCNLFKVKGKPRKLAREVTAKLENDNIFDIETIRKRREAAKLERKKAAERTRRKNALIWADLELWRKGEKAAIFDFRRLPCALRINGDQVETSHGATVRLPYALLVFGAWQSRRDNPDGLAWLSGQKCDQFTITSASRDNIEIGCHSIAYLEAVRTLSKTYESRKESGARFEFV